MKITKMHLWQDYNTFQQSRERISGYEFFLDNKALRSRVWEGNAQYISGGGAPVLGKLVISSDSFTFRTPKDPYGFPMLGEKIPARTDALSFADSGVVLRCVKGAYSFELFPSSLKSLKEWYVPKAETLKVVTRLDGSFLGNYNAYPHPFAETHSGEGQDKDQIYHFLRDCIPALKEPFKWGLDDITLQIEESWTECHISEWNYLETENFIRIDCDRYECGFFDDSEQGMGNFSLVPKTTICVNNAEIAPYCIAIALLYFAYTGQKENQVLTVNNRADQSMLKFATKSLKTCYPKWQCKISE